MTSFIVSSFGLFVMGLFEGLFTAPSWQTFLLLTCGWTLTTEHHTITTYLWLTGAGTVKHFSCFYVFLGGALYTARWQLWARIIRVAAQWVPPGEPIVIEVDDSTKKKRGLRSKGSRTIAMARARPGRNIARCGGSTLCGGSCGSRSQGGRASVLVFPSGCRSTSKRNQRSNSTCPIPPAVPWPARSWTLLRPNSPRERFAS